MLLTRQKIREVSNWKIVNSLECCVEETEVSFGITVSSVVG